MREVVIKRKGNIDVKRAAIEVLILKDLINRSVYEVESEHEVESTGIVRLRERSIDSTFLWCVSEYQKADILTKLSDSAARRTWLDECN